MTAEWKYEPARDLGLPVRDRTRSLKRESGLLQTAAYARATSATSVRSRPAARAVSPNSRENVSSTRGDSHVTISPSASSAPSACIFGPMPPT